MKKILNKCKSREHCIHVLTTHFKNYQCFCFISLCSSSSEVVFFVVVKLEYFKANPKAPFTTNISIIGMKRLLCGPVFLFLQIC